MRRYIITVFLALFSLSLFALPAEDIELLNNRDFVPKVIELINNADSIINVVVFEARYYESHPEGVNRKFSKALIDAAKRGVKITLILDASTWNRGNTIKNYQYAQWIRPYGIKVLFDDPEVTCHNKLVMVDHTYTVVGSTNWTYYAFEKNNESSVLIKSPEVTRAFEDYFNEILKTSTEDLPLIEEWKRGEK